MLKQKQKKSKAKAAMVIDSKALMVKSSEKLGRHDSQVKSGCGVHQSKRTYTRKIKHKELMSS